MNTTELIIELTLMPMVAFVVGLAMVLMMRKIAARIQRRIGPPLLQPLYDIVKLYGKQTQTSHGLIHEIGIIMAVGGYVAAETLLPVPGMNGLADILLITGYVSIKTLKRVILTYEQMPAPKYVIGICSCTVNGGMYWQSYATAKVLREYMPVDVYIAGCMPRPEAVISGLRKLMGDIKSGRADSWKKYFQNYDFYLGNQQKLFGEHWQTPTDIIAEAQHYELITDQTLGEHTALLEKHQRPLDALEMRLTNKEKQKT